MPNSENAALSNESVQDAYGAWVSEDDLKRSLERLRQRPLQPNEGLFGPGSMFWEVNRHALVYFPGAVQAVQMQLAHPWIATAVFEHSKIMTNPRRRAQLTYIYLWSIIYGDVESAVKKSYSLYRLHTRVQGTLPAEAGRFPAGSTYAANEANALLWVHVTAFYTRVHLYERLVQPLTQEEKDSFCDDARVYAHCFGIPADKHPRDWNAVEAYVAAMQASDALAPTDAGLTISRFLRDSIPRPLRSAVWTFLCLSLPERTRHILELPGDSAANQARFRRILWMLERLQRLLPARLTNVPAYSEAQRRLAGKAGPGWLTGVLNRLLLGIPRLVS